MRLPNSLTAGFWEWDMATRPSSTSVAPPEAAARKKWLLLIASELSALERDEDLEEE
jgi:hypothetical protein